MLMEDKEIKELTELAKPLVKFIREKYHPHATIVIDYSGLKLKEDTIGIPILGTKEEE
ncbi:hypothetical protein [Bacillus phage YungSlug]|nr:hypothetical protein [Bacillus phage YungSlug]